MAGLFFHFLGNQKNIRFMIVCVKNLDKRGDSLRISIFFSVKRIDFYCSIYFQTLRLAHFVVEEPMVIGHECAGIIEEVGSQVKNLVPGDRVAIEPGISCWRCDFCKDGRYNLCPDMKFFATPPVHGSLANQVWNISNFCSMVLPIMWDSKC